MGSSSRRARRRQRAQESLEKETSHLDPLRSPVKRSKPDSDRDEEEDHEVLFPPRKQDTVIIPYLYNYDVLVKLLSDRFDPASGVSAFRSRFHGDRVGITKTQTH